MKLHLKDNFYTYLDDEDYERIVTLLEDDRADPAKWQLTFNKTDKKVLYYASKTIGGRKGKKWKLHRLIMTLRGIDIDGMEIDHEDNDTLNNHFSNLRVATSGQNKINRGVRRDNKLGMKGVERLPSGRYAAYFVDNGKKTHIGVFDTVDEAGTAYNLKAIEKWGPYAKLNTIRKPKSDTI